MLKDIDSYSVDFIAIALVKEDNSDEMWQVYILNLDKDKLDTVIVNSKGYSDSSGECKETATIRRMINDLPPYSYQKLEEIPHEVASLNNEFWISFFNEGRLLEKKIIVRREDLQADKLVKIPLLQRNGFFIQ